MPIVRVKLTQYHIKKVKYSRSLDEAIKQQMRMAARAFLNVALRAIPVRTGFAAGSLKNLSEAAGVGGTGKSPASTYLNTMRILRNTAFKQSSIFNISRQSLKDAGASMRVEYYRDGKRKIVKTPQSGRQFATQPSQIFQSDGFIYTFNFESFISYLTANDMFSTPQNYGKPWRAFEYGRATFQNYMKTVALTKLPRVQDFITESVVSVSGDSLNREATQED